MNAGVWEFIIEKPIPPSSGLTQRETSQRVRWPLYRIVMFDPDSLDAEDFETTLLDPEYEVSPSLATDWVMEDCDRRRAQLIIRLQHEEMWAIVPGHRADGKTLHEVLGSNPGGLRCKYQHEFLKRGRRHCITFQRREKATHFFKVLGAQGHHIHEHTDLRVLLDGREPYMHYWNAKCQHFLPPCDCATGSPPCRTVDELNSMMEFQEISASALSLGTPLPEANVEANISKTWVCLGIFVGLLSILVTTLAVEADIRWAR